MEYKSFLEQKQFISESSGFDIDLEEINPMLFHFQKLIVRCACCKGKYAVFSECGTGKTPIQLEWAYQVIRHTTKPGYEETKVIIFAPLSVCEQTVREGEKFGIEVNLAEKQSDCKPGINITNYEKIEKFVANEFVGVVLDESSILKSFSGKRRNQIIDNYMHVPYKLACTATPSPNDYMELGNHSEFLGVMKRSEMLSMYFVHDGGDTSKWRLKGHCESIFWQWVASWAVMLTHPRDLGYEQEGYDLPPIEIHEIVVDNGGVPINEKLTLTERRNARRESLELRCQTVADIIKNDPNGDQYIVWCNLNDEQKRLSELIEDNVSIEGATKPALKIEREKNWREGSVQTLVSKPLIFGFGLNWQHCHKMIFTGLSDSYEQYYQALRRCWRFGQTKKVDVYIVISAKEGCVRENIDRKEKDFINMRNEMVKLTKEITKKELEHTVRMTTEYIPTIPLQLPIWSEFSFKSKVLANGGIK